MMTRIRYCVLRNDEETDLIQRMNAFFRQNRSHIVELRIVRRGFGAGLWRKVKCNEHMYTSRYTYMELRPYKSRLIRTNLSNDKFALCVNTDLTQFAAVTHNHTEICSLTTFPYGINSEWRYIWAAFRHVAKECCLEVLSFRVLHRAQIVPDCIVLILQFLVPIWARRCLYHSLERVWIKNDIFFRILKQ